MKLPHTICYISKSKENLGEEGIKEILDQAIEANNKCEVSGILLHSLGNFFQVLEGEKNYITTLFNKIVNDPRHFDVFEVYNKPSAKPVFMNYNSSFRVLTSNEELDQIRSYLDNHRVGTTSKKLKRLLRPFIFLD